MENEFKITDGTVEYRHAMPIAEYNSKNPMVKLSYTIAEGSDPQAVSAKVMNMAIDLVEAAIKGNVPVEKAFVQPVDVGADLVQGMENAVVEVKKRTRRTKEQIALDALAADGQAMEKVVDLAGIDSADEDADLGILATEQEAEPEISDKDLQTQAQKVSAYLRGEFGNINNLRELINSCQEGETGTLLTIPSDKRYDFMQKSKGLFAMKR